MQLLRMVCLGIIAQGRPEKLSISVSDFFMLWKERKRERKSLFLFSLCLDDVCGMKQFSLELVGKHRQEQKLPGKFLDFCEV